MPFEELQMLKCKISAGVFSGELFFKVATVGGGVHEGVASRRYFRNEDNQALEGDSPGIEDEDGLVAALVLRRDGSTALVSIPDGAVITAESTTVTDHPFKDAACVPVG